MKTVIAVIFSLCLLFVFSCCDMQNQSSKTSNNDIENNGITQNILPQKIDELSAATNQENGTQETKKVRYEINITLDNYLTFFDITVATTNYSIPFVFSGCLSYAFYDNVIVSFKYNNEIKTILLNAAGNGQAPRLGASESATLYNISGKVIFWI